MMKHKFKYLTDDMKKIIDKEIKKIGRDALYDKVEYNLQVDKMTSLMNKPDAFKTVYKNPCWRTTQWEYEYYLTPEIIDLNNLDQETLFYIDRRRFANGGYKINNNGTNKKTDR